MQNRTTHSGVDVHSAPITALLAAVRSDRLWQAHMDMATLGATAKGGVRRLALTDVDNAARMRLIAQARNRGYEVFMDPAGNIFVRRAGRDTAAAPVMTGSHLDSQPTGGKFDGPLGVLAGMEVLYALDEAGIETERPVEVVSWTNEEGCRFIPGCMGSSCFASPQLLDDWELLSDHEGITVSQELQKLDAALSDVPRRPLGVPVAAYLEMHIEQGVVLENEKATVGVVSGIQGCRDFRVTISGTDSHAGTTPSAFRRDALKCAVHMLGVLYARMDMEGSDLRFTVGELNVLPNSSSVIPGRVTFLIDFRHPSQSALSEIGNEIREICLANAGQCEVTIEEIRWRAPVLFPESMKLMIQNAADRQGKASRTLLSGASHDAVHLHRCCPSGMIFIPCAGGISHNEAESADASDIHAGTQVLAEVVYRLAMQPSTD